MPRNRVIDWLRRIYPGEWRYEYPVWKYAGGFNVVREMEVDKAGTLVPRYRRTDTGEIVWVIADRDWKLYYLGISKEALFREGLVGVPQIELQFEEEHLE